MANIIEVIPPEILASIFETVIYSCGITSILPISLVCTAWRDIIDHTPRLWGIILFEKHTPPHILHSQISKAKAAPLSVTIPVRLGRKHQEIISRLTSLSHNWVSAEVSIQHLIYNSPEDAYCNLETLVLSRGRPQKSLGVGEESPTKSAQIVSKPTFVHPAKLHSFSAIGIGRSWVLPFLSFSIRHFRLRQKGDILQNMHDLERYLVRIPQLVTLELDHFYFSNPLMRSEHSSTILLRNLEVLRLTNMSYSPAILCALTVPSLQLLTISALPLLWDSTYYVWIPASFRRYKPTPMAPLFSQWSQDGIIPANLHTLELHNCLLPGDISYLIRWLARLPNLVSLSLKDDGVHRSMIIPPDVARQFYDSLALPQPRIDSDEAVWICPSLTILHLEIANRFLTDLLPIAQSRGKGASPIHGILPPKQLRRVEAQICPLGVDKVEERILFDSLIEQPYCICHNFGLGLGCMGAA
ncbi:hypothetical protein BDN70DRAFT_876280 [Pholiota conissans]|uniref:F-box domain-containing protein n=1 Tax=Pholiota conissans TaxID=109636 RepID=A0A9P5Z5J1_9AGAR|nr:hypothetical protein BDN70DRAFT_876280 [Pholiota conissans]